MVGGVSSAISAAWIRREVLDQYDTATPGSGLKQRLKNRAPLAVAGLGFTSLSTVASVNFDKFELQALADSNSPYPAHQQLNNHRALHSLPYIGGAILTAHLLREGAAKLGHQIASRLKLSHCVDEIIDGLNGIADWLINSLGTGIIGHIIGDIPTSSPIRLLAPLSDRNLAMNLITNSNPAVNKCLHAAGWSLVGGAWAVAGLYLLCKTPPDIQIRSFAERIASTGSVGELVRRVNADLREFFIAVTGMTQRELEKSSIFREESNNTPSHSRELPWGDFQPDTQTIWGVEEITPTSLSDSGIIPESVSSQLVQASSDSLWTANQKVSEETYWSEASADTFWETSSTDSLRQESSSKSFVKSRNGKDSFYY
ncbi:metal-dependent hydrolase [Halobacterium salinarum]|uniref:metal-dependent hydrolase n=1 Tax=Halobacterium salinarum TaxID=2242 RepID=UPI002552F180|nr:metal-dependent hydrolase [Halobacterium salinarum]MDL0135060.1 metal-dependent hydrolase [Halobacterium salinarum]